VTFHHSPKRRGGGFLQVGSFRCITGTADFHRPFQFASAYVCVSRCLNSKTNLSALKADHLYGDPSIDLDCFVQLSTQDQHFVPPKLLLFTRHLPPKLAIQNHPAGLAGW
jgi:hypothetical protein